jgi:hypothetical protein
MKIKTKFANYHETTWMVNTYGISLISWEPLEMVLHKKLKVHNMGFQPISCVLHIVSFGFPKDWGIAMAFNVNYQKLFDNGSTRYSFKNLAHQIKGL